MNPLWLILLLGGGALYVSKLKNVGKNLSINIINVETFKIVSGALQLAINIALDNPTNTSITVKKPYIKAFYQENEVGNSLPSDDKIKIESNTRTIMKNINIQIPFSNLPSIVLSLLSNESRNKMNIDVEISTDVNGILVTTRKTISV